MWLLIVSTLLAGSSLTVTSLPSGHQHQQHGYHPSGYHHHQQEPNNEPYQEQHPDYEHSNYQREFGHHPSSVTQTRAYALAKKYITHLHDFLEEYFDPSLRTPDVGTLEGLIGRDPDQIRFLLYSDPNMPELYEEIKYQNYESLQRSRYNPHLPLKILFHGFQEGPNSSCPQDWKNAYLATKPVDDHNVIVVDWSAMAMPGSLYISLPLLPVVLSNVAVAGHRVGDFITWLVRENAVDPSGVHIVGFSLGAHAAGQAGDTVKRNLGQPVARITACEPSAIGFTTGAVARRLSRKDAVLVDVIHTNAGQLGFAAQIGTIDYFVNGGTGPQPGCVEIRSSAGVLSTAVGTLTGFCSHQMSPKIFANTILEGATGGGIMTCSCDSPTPKRLSFLGPHSCCDKHVPFGAYIPPSMRGTYYISYVLEEASKDVREGSNGAIQSIQNLGNLGN